MRFCSTAGSAAAILAAAKPGELAANFTTLFVLLGLHGSTGYMLCLNMLTAPCQTSQILHDMQLSSLVTVCRRLRIFSTHSYHPLVQIILCSFQPCQKEQLNQAREHHMIRPTCSCHLVCSKQTLCHIAVMHQRRLQATCIGSYVPVSAIGQPVLQSTIQHEQMLDNEAVTPAHPVNIVAAPFDYFPAASGNFFSKMCIFACFIHLLFSAVQDDKAFCWTVK